MRICFFFLLRLSWWPAHFRFALTKFTCNWRSINVHVVEGVLNGNKACYEYVCLNNKWAPYSCSKSSRSHPKVVLQSVFVGNFSPKANLSTKNSAFVHTSWENNKVLIDLSPDAVNTLSAVKPKVSLSLAEIEDVRR